MYVTNTSLRLGNTGKLWNYTRNQKLSWPRSGCRNLCIGVYVLFQVHTQVYIQATLVSSGIIREIRICLWYSECVFVCKCVCLCVAARHCMFMYDRVCVCVWECVYVYVYICIYTCIYMCTYICHYIYICMFFLWNKYMYMYMYTYVYIYIYIYFFFFLYMNIYIYIVLELCVKFAGLAYS